MSLLQEMTSGIMDTKATKAAKLTPVAGESGMTVAEAAAKVGIPEVPEVFLTNEAVRDVARDLRRQAALLIEVANALDGHTGEPTERFDVKRQQREDTKAAEAAADIKATKAGIVLTPQAAAISESIEVSKAAMLAAADDGGSVPVAEGWVCPDHGSEHLTTVTARHGRTYRMCDVGDCEHFEK